ncbi:MAG TPA: benzoate-CoA ligase family protein [Achromobacter sp.]|nr:benzoate-CoA ligase family protein [Achromobacter sp.]
MLREQARRKPTAIAIRQKDFGIWKPLSWADYWQRACRVGLGLRALGLGAGGRVAIVSENRVEWLLTQLGAGTVGGVAVGVYSTSPAEEMGYVLEHADVELVVCEDQEQTDKVLQVAHRLPLLRRIVMMETKGLRSYPPADRTRIVTFAEVEADGARREAVEFPALNAALDTQRLDDTGLMIYTSGSTGKPKGVVHTHGNLWHTAELYAKPVLGIREDDVVFSAAKLFFAYGLGNGLTFPLSVGATVILMGERPTPQAVFQRLTRHRPTVFYGVPTLYASMLASPDLPPRDQVALRVCTSAGEALPRDIGERFTRHFGCEILDGIGSTEMLHIFISNQTGQLRYGTTGKPVPGYEVQLRDDNGAPVAPGAIGDLYIKGPSAALMYWNNRDKTRQCFLGDWLKSGDKYTCDADGYYTYAGRSDDMIKVSGQYVSPVEVENILVQHEAVLEAAVIGVPDHDGLVKTKAYVVLRPGFEPDAQTGAALQHYVKQHLAPFKYPRQIDFTEELPKTATGKIQRFRLRQLEEATL